MFGLGGGFGSGSGLRGPLAMGPRHFLEAFQLFEGAVIDALAGIDDPLEALEGGGIGGEGVAGSAGDGGLDIFYQEGVAGGQPELGLDAAHAAETPFVGNERVDEETLFGIRGAVQLVIFGGEVGEILGFFVEHDLVNGEEAVLQGVESGDGFSRGGARAGGFLCVRAVSGGLFCGCHEKTSIRG